MLDTKPRRTKRLFHPAAIAAGTLLLTLGGISGVPRFAAAQKNATPATLAVGDAFSRLLPREAAAIDAVIAAQMETDAVSGVAIGVVQKGQIVYLKGYGKADAKGTPITAHTMFRWASISKCLTAIAAMQLVEQNKLDLERDVREYVPEFPDKGTTITSRLLLCHQSGIPHYSNGKVIVTKRTYNTAHPFVDVVTGLDFFKESPLLFAPGEKYSYSTYGFNLLSAVVQRAGKQKFIEQVQERIAAPLGMTTLQPDYPWQNIPRRADGFRKNAAGKVVPSKEVDVSWKLGGGGFISSVEDLARFAQGLINRQLVNDVSRQQMWTPQRTRGGSATGYGLGFGVKGNLQASALEISHSGSQEKARTLMVLHPNRRDGVVIMSNCEWTRPTNFSTAVFRALTAPEL